MRTSLLTLRASAGKRQLGLLVVGSCDHHHLVDSVSIEQPGLLFVEDSLQPHSSEEASLPSASQLMVALDSSHAHSSSSPSVGQSLILDDFSSDTLSSYTIFQQDAGTSWTHNSALGTADITANGISADFIFGRSNLDLPIAGYFKTVFIKKENYSASRENADYIEIRNSSGSNKYEFWFTNSGEPGQGGRLLINSSVVYDSKQSSGTVDDINGVYTVEGWWGKDSFSMKINGVEIFSTTHATAINDLSQVRYRVYQHNIGLDYFYVGNYKANPASCAQAVISEDVSLTSFDSVSVQSSLHAHSSDEVLLKGIRAEKAKHTHTSDEVAISASISGSGTTQDPYLIYESQHLFEIKKNPTASFRLERDIVMEEAWVPFWFAGELDGNRHTIDLTGLLFERRSGESGFFQVNTGTITHLGLIGGTFRTGSGNLEYKGSLAGENRGNISFCFARGGVVDTGGDRAGGLVGYNIGDITECYAAQSRLINNHSSRIGGIVGWHNGTGQRNFFDHETWGDPYQGVFSNFGTGKTTVEMQTESTFNTWSDFWIFGYGYPKFATTISEDSSHAHSADEASVVEYFVLSVEESTHTHTADGVIVTGTLNADDSVHAHSSSTPIVSEFDLLIPEESQHSNVSDVASVVEHPVVSVLDSRHVSVSDEITLTEHPVVVVEDARSTQTADEVTLVVAGTLAVQESLHTNKVDNTQITEHASVTALDSTQAQSSDATSLTEHASVQVQESTHSNKSDEVTLTEHASLTLQNSVQSNKSDEVVLSGFTQDNNLGGIAVDNNLGGQAIDGNN